PIGGDDQTVTDFTAEASRLFVEAKREMNGQTVKGYVEMDFLGSLQGNERVSNSFSPRLRRAFVTVNGWLLGQEWSTFQNTTAIPESASFLTLSDGMVFIRQPQIRYTRGNFQIALENGDTTITSTTGARIEADSNAVPDVVLRYNAKGDYGNVSIAGIARQLRADLPGFEEEDFGYGLSISGRLNAAGKDDIRFNLFGGEGLGRYVGLNAVNGAAVDPLTGNLEAISSYGGLIAYRHPFGDTARVNIGYSGLWADNPDFAMPAMTKSVQSVYGAVLWDVAPKTTVGAELLLGTRENEAGDDGTLTRLTLSTKYAF
ncbi:MAG: DcaP family trimeric outer membrane transporter, partial [Pseudomonadota bacterium]